MTNNERAHIPPAPSSEHLPNAIARLQRYIDAASSIGHSATAYRDEKGTTYLIMLDDLRAVLEAARRSVEPKPSVEVIGQWFTSSHGVAVAAVAPMTDRGPAVMVDGRVISPNDAAALVEFKPQGEPSDAQIDTVAAAIAKAANADYWTDEISDWENAEEWYREAYPNEHPHSAYEDREGFRKQARAALRATPAVTERGENR